MIRGVILAPYPSKGGQTFCTTVPTLSIQNLKVAISGKLVLFGVNLTVRQGEIHVLMGPNGSGKSTLALTLFGYPKYRITDGTITFGNKKLNGLTADRITKLGMLLAFQYPQNVSGVSLYNLLRAARAGQKTGKSKVGVEKFSKELQTAATSLGLAKEFLSRSLNEGFSGGEKKKTEVLQVSLLRPKLAIFDETDSGLDVDALRLVAKQINRLARQRVSILLITHYNRIFKYIKPDCVHVMYQGKIVRLGGRELAEEIEKFGYAKLGRSVKCKVQSAK